MMWTLQRYSLGTRRAAGSGRWQENGPLLALLALCACSSTSFVSTWKTPGATPVDLRGSKVVASGSGTAGANGAATLKLKFTAAGRKALKKAKSAKLTVDVTYTPASGDAVKSQVKLTLKR